MLTSFSTPVFTEDKILQEYVIKN
ncbi:uncharacterized protein METZ01_LOCUS42460 [marine metagenome]|uniref:Uncharacterized protein n=1 Tax=marine metagenome TaxID=408172 RepID=A0A381RCT3_9ZZZZ